MRIESEKYVVYKAEKETPPTHQQAFSLVDQRFVIAKKSVG